MEKKGVKKDTLCFECGRCDCCWMRDLKPVPGWWAVEHKRGESTSYRVISCPEYRKATKEDKHVHDIEGMQTLMSVIAEKAYKDYITAKLWLNRVPDDKDAKRNLRKAKEFLEKGFTGTGEEFAVSVERLDRMIGNCTTMEELKERGLKK